MIPIGTEGTGQALHLLTLAEMCMRWPEAGAAWDGLAVSDWDAQALAIVELSPTPPGGKSTANPAGRAPVVPAPVLWIKLDANLLQPWWPGRTGAELPDEVRAHVLAADRLEAEAHTRDMQRGVNRPTDWTLVTAFNNRVKLPLPLLATIAYRWDPTCRTLTERRETTHSEDGKRSITRITPVLTPSPCWHEIYQPFLHNPPGTKRGGGWTPPAQPKRLHVYSDTIARELRGFRHNASTLLRRAEHLRRGPHVKGYDGAVDVIVAGHAII